MIRRIGYTGAGIAAGVIIVWLDWHPGSANPAVPTNRVALIGVVLILAVLPWAVRPMLGPVADNRVARVVRAGGYGGVYLLLLVLVGLSRFAGSRFDHFRAFDQKNWESDMRAGAVVGAAVAIVVVGGYAVAILAITSRRASVSPTTLAAGTGVGVAAALIMYALMPLGNALNPDNALLAAGYRIVLLLAPLSTCLAAGLFAGRRVPNWQGRPSAAGRQVAETELNEARVRHGGLAGLCAGGTAALLLSIVTIGTMLLLPRHVELKWANPDPTVAHGTAFEVRMSVGDAASKYEFGLVLGPLIGLMLGAVAGAGLAGRREPPDPQRPVPAKPVAVP